MSPQGPSYSRQPGNYLAEDTIAALSSPVGGAISLLRVSGPEAIAALENLTGKDLSARVAREVFRCAIFTGQGPARKELDDATAVIYRAPKSYTGEDLAEIFLHGSPFIATEVLRELADRGVRSALPGEFSFRAVRNGKLNLSQAQAVADLVSASNQGAVDLALEKLGGTQSALVSGLAEELRMLASLGELGIDFADQDVEEVSLPRLKDRAREVIAKLERLESSFDRGFRIQEGISVAFIGRPNAGKSSFFNALLGEDRSIVTEIAGTTRDVVREKLTLRGRGTSVTLRLEDTAGIRVGTDDRVEKIGIERSTRAAGAADLILFLIDLATLDSERAEILEIWRDLGRPSNRAVVILTKRDRLKEEEWEKAQAWARSEFGGLVVAVSSTEGEGIEEASEAIIDFCERRAPRAAGEVLLTQFEQVEAVRGSLGHLRQSLETTEESLFAADLRHALLNLTPLIGETVPDDLLGRIFSKFCIGK